MVVTDKNDRTSAVGNRTHLSDALALELRVTHGQNLVSDQNIRVQVSGHRECQAHIHAVVECLTGVSMNLEISASSTISSKRAVTSRRLMPNIVPFRKMLSRPVRSGLNPVPTSSRLETRPRNSATPSVGSVIRESTFNNVDFPAPLRPTMPSTSPRFTSKLTSRSAQIVSAVSIAPKWRNERRRRSCESARRFGAPRKPRMTCRLPSSHRCGNASRFPQPSGRGLRPEIAQATSAMARSMRRKYQGPLQISNELTKPDSAIEPTGIAYWWSRAARKPDMTPTSGLSE